MDEMGFFVSKNLHHDAIKHIFYAPMSFFDTTVRRYAIPPQLKLNLSEADWSYSERVRQRHR